MSAPTKKNADLSLGKNSSYIAVIKYAQINPSALQLGPISTTEFDAGNIKKNADLTNNFINTELKFEFCFIDFQSFVTYASPGCLSIFETNPELLRAGSILITSWIETFESKKFKICTDKGENVNLLLKGGVTIKAQCFGQHICVGPDSYILLQFNISTKALASTRRTALLVKNDTGSNKLKGDNSSAFRDTNSVGSRRSFNRGDSISLNDTTSLNGSTSRRKIKKVYILYTSLIIF